METTNARGEKVFSAYKPLDMPGLDWAMIAEVSVDGRRVGAGTGRTKKAAEQQAATADEVSGNIQQVDHAATALLEGAQAVSNAAEQLRQGSQALAQNTARFKLD